MTKALTLQIRNADGFSTKLTGEVESDPSVAKVVWSEFNTSGRPTTPEITYHPEFWNGWNSRGTSLSARIDQIKQRYLETRSENAVVRENCRRLALELGRSIAGTQEVWSRIRVTRQVLQCTVEEIRKCVDSCLATSQ